MASKWKNKKKGGGGGFSCETIAICNLIISQYKTWNYLPIVRTGI